MYAEIACVLVSLGTQFQAQVILDPDYLPNYLSAPNDYTCSHFKFKIINEKIHNRKFKNLSKNLEKYVFHWEKCNFKHIGNSAHMTESLVLRKALNVYVNYFVSYPCRQHVK